MYGDYNMKNINISNDDINIYIDTLINQSFSILPLYEENGMCPILIQKINNIDYKLNNFFKINSFDSNIIIETLAFINGLRDANSHDEVRFFVLKICALLSSLKAVIE